MVFQYAAKEFGTCPLVQCAGQPVLPVGLKDEMGADTVKIFCPKCQCVYHPPPVRSRSSHHGGAGAAGVDGAAFGTTFPHLFLMTFSNLVPDRLPPDSAYVPRVFGFRVHMSARQRTSGSSSGVVASSNSRPDNNRRLNFTRRSEAVSKESRDTRPKDTEEAANKNAITQDGTPALQSQDTANNDSYQKSGTKGASTSSKQSRGNEDNSTKDDEGKKAKAGKRRNEGDASSKKSDGNGNGFLDNSPKRRRKGDSNGNG